MPAGGSPGGGEVRDDGTLASIGEDALVGGIIARFPPLPPWVEVGPGDDAAVLSVPGAVVASTDTLVEGRDFLRAWSSGHEVGVKVAAQNFADLAAMGAVPMALLVSVAAPADVPVAWTAALTEGLQDEAVRAGAHVVGGDVSEASEIVLTGTALGRLPDGVRAVRRSGARVGDQVALAGRTGPSAAGLALLGAGSTGWREDDALASLVRAHLAPRPPYRAGPAAAAAGATSMIDTSDGLIRDATRLADASGVCLALDTTRLAPQEPLLAAARTLAGDVDSRGGPDADEALDPAEGAPEVEEVFARARGWVLTGGEDHALLATFPRGIDLPSGWRVIGSVQPRERDAVLVDRRSWEGASGWTHF